MRLFLKFDEKLIFFYLLLLELLAQLFFFFLQDSLRCFFVELNAI